MFENVTDLKLGNDNLIKLEINGNVVWEKPSSDFVDLGITDSDGNHVLFATKNLGATSPYEIGWYIAWGELGTTEEGYADGVKTNGYSYDSYKFAQGASGYKKYISSDEKLILEDEDDVVTSLMGDGYRMPLSAEFEALVNTSNFTWTYDSTNKGWNIVSKIAGYEGKSIFMRLTGYYNNTDLLYTTNGVYFAKDLYSADPDRYYANDLVFTNKKSSIRCSNWRRVYGCIIRPVKVVTA